ncbi:hypothetical protein BGZ63DRAFT_405725 [Mariannaea sp. PMI_226]|nr:hypothetical protein BGZ63DRAFT_405725 [Mariannaea sp. PMI_226]
MVSIRVLNSPSRVVADFMPASTHAQTGNYSVAFPGWDQYRGSGAETHGRRLDSAFVGLGACRFGYITARELLHCHVASQLRIQSILSPADPEVDEPFKVLSDQSPNRKFGENLSTPEVAPAALPAVESPDSRRPGSAGIGVDPVKSNVEEQRTPVPLGNRDARKSARMRPPLRSSIACVRCRRSKIKCDNDGGNSPCDTCIKGGHQCQYPETAQPPPKRNEPPAPAKQDKEGTHERKRARKTEDIIGLDPERSAAYAEEVLSYPFLTVELWDQLLSIYRLHFATELPFLHLPTLKEKISHRQDNKFESSVDLNLILLGVLTLTARFHSDLVKYVAHFSSVQGNARVRTIHPKVDPSAASEYFANVLSTALGPLKVSMNVMTVERVQACLMLGVFEWSQQNTSIGHGAWMYVGMAIRMAQALKLGLDDLRATQLEQTGRRTDQPQESRRRSSEISIIRETRRRTMFSCLIMDRMMACGHDRVPTLRRECIRIQLPCTEMAFDLALNVNTGYLNVEDRPGLQINDDSVLSRFVQLGELWASISCYSSTGGRLLEQVPPWNDASTFRKLLAELNHFAFCLPDTFAFSRQNYYRHDNHQATNMYVSLHMLLSVCRIILTREYLPFLPLRCTGPAGPLGNPPYPHNQAPAGFWSEVTNGFFRSARDIVTMVEISRDKLPHSSLTLFSVWLAAFGGLYAQQFPFMDPQHEMVSQEDIDRRVEGDLSVVRGTSTGLAYQTLHKMAACLPRAQNYLKYFEAVDVYYTEAEADFRHHNEQGASLSSAETQQGGHLSIRLGGDANAPEEWRPQARRSTDMVMMAGDEPRMMPYEASDRSATDLGSPVGVSEACSTGDYAQTPRSTPTMSFKAMNTSMVRSGSAESLPLSTREGTLKAVTTQPGSMFAIPGLEPENMRGGLPEFSLDKLGVIESERIAKILNDLEEFSGAGTLGGGFSLN